MSENLNLEIGFTFKEEELGKNAKKVLESLNDKFQLDVGLSKHSLSGVLNAINEIKKNISSQEIDLTYNKNILSDIESFIDRIQEKANGIKVDVKYNRSNLSKIEKYIEKVDGISKESLVSLGTDERSFVKLNNELSKIEKAFESILSYRDDKFEIGYNGTLSTTIIEDLNTIIKLNDKLELGSKLDVSEAREVLNYILEVQKRIKGFELNVEADKSQLENVMRYINEVKNEASKLDLTVDYDKRMFTRIMNEITPIEEAVEQIQLDIKGDTKMIDEIKSKLLGLSTISENLLVSFNKKDFNKLSKDIKSLKEDAEIDFGLTLPEPEIFEPLQTAYEKLKKTVKKLSVDFQFDKKAMSDLSREVNKILKVGEAIEFEVLYNKEAFKELKNDIKDVVSVGSKINLDTEVNKEIFGGVIEEIKKAKDLDLKLDLELSNQESLINEFQNTLNRVRHVVDNTDVRRLNLNVEYDKSVFDKLVGDLDKIREIGNKLNVGIDISGNLFGELQNSLNDVKGVLKNVEDNYKIKIGVEADVDKISKEIGNKVNDVEVNVKVNEAGFGDIADTFEYMTKSSVVKINGEEVKKAKQFKNEFGDTLDIVDDIVNGVRKTTFNTNNAKEQKAIYSECVSLVKNIENNKKAINGASESIKKVLTEINLRMSEQLNTGKELLKDKQLIEQLNKKIEKSEDSVSDYIKKQRAEVESVIEARKESLRIRLQEVEAGRYSEHTEQNRIEEARVAIESLRGENLKQLNANIKEVENAIDAIGADAKAKAVMRTGSALDGLTKTLQTLGLYKSLDEMFQMLFNELSNGVGHVREVDKAFTNMAMTMDTLTTGKFNDMIGKINKLSQSMGAVSSDVLQIAQTYANDSTTIESVIDKLSASTALMNISGLSPQDVTSSIMSIANSYQLLNDETDNVAEVTEYLGDVLAKTSANMEMDFSEGLSGLVNGIGVAGSTMRASGVDMEWFVGQLGNLMVATGLGAEQLGRSMRTITARVMQQKQALQEMGESVEEVEIQMAQGEKALKEIGVSIRNDLSGELKPFSEIMGDIASKWDGLTDSTKYFIAEMMAGKNQMDVFIGMMDSYDSAMELVNNAYESQGTLMQMNEKYLNSIEGKIQTLTSAKENLYRTVINSDAFKTLVDTGTLLINSLTGLIENIKVVTSSIGTLPSIVGSATTALLAYKMATSETNLVKDVLISSVRKMITSFKNGESSIKTMTVAMNSGVSVSGLFGKAMNSGATAVKGLVSATSLMNVALSVGVVGAITAVVSVVGVLIDRFKNASKYAQETADSISSSFSNINDGIEQSLKVDSLLEQYESLNTKINSNALDTEELKKAQDELAETKSKLLELFPTAIQGYDEEGNAILDNIDYIKELNEVEKERLKIEQEALAIKAQANYDSELENLENATKRRDEILEQLRKSQADLSSYEVGSVEYDSITTAIDELYESLKKANEEVASYQTVVNTYEKALGIAKGATQEFTFSLDECREATAEAMKDGFGEEAFNSVTKSADEAQGKFLEVSQTLETTRDILKDINENGVTTSNIEKMRSLYNDFAGDITNTAQVQEFLNGKISEMQEAHDRAYVQMITTTDEWRRYNNDVQNEIVRITAKAVGMQEDEWAKYINALGGFRSVDLSNAKNLGDAKLQTEKQLIQQLVTMWKNYYTTLMTNTWKAQGHNIENMSIAKAQELEKQTLKANEEARKAYEAFTKLQNSMDSIGGSITVTPSLNQSSVGKLGSGSSSSGSGSRPSGSNTEKDVADLELVIDRYYALNDAINDVNNALDKNSIQKDNAKTIEEYNKLVEEEVRLTNQKIKALENLRREQEKEASELKNSIAKQGGTFDSSGNLTNYHKLLTDAQNKANKLSGTAKENAIANVNALKEMIDKYTELTNSSIPNTTNQILEMKNAIEDIRKEQEEIIKQVEKLGERYYNVLQSIKKVDNELALVKAKQENAHGKERVELLVREIELMKEKQKLLQQQQNESITEATEIYNDLKKQGVQFNEDGAIKNYDALMKKLTDKVNSLVGTARDEELEKAEALIELIEKYDELVKDTIPSLGVEWIETNNDIIALEKSKLETIADVQKQITQAITSELKKQTEATKKEIDKQKQLYLDSYEEEDYQNDLAKEQRKLDEIQQQINNLARDTSLAGQLKLQDLMQQYQEQQDAINNMIRDHEKQQGSDRFDEEMNKLDEKLENALDPKNMAQLVADALTTGLVSVGDQVVELDKLMADFAVESEGAITALSNTIRAEMIESLKEASSLVENLGASYQTLIGYNETLSKNKHLNDVKTINSSSPKIEFNAPILTIEGDVAQDLESRLHEFANQVQNTVMKTVGRALSTI